MASGTFKGAAAGVAGLVALQLVLRPDNAGKVGGLFALPAAAARWLISPAIPAIPDRRKNATPAPPPASTSTPAASTAPPPATAQDKLRSVPVQV